jgi:hypothetical protein
MGNYWMVSSPYHHHTTLEPIQIGTNSGRVMLPFKRRTGVSLLYDIKNFYIFVAFFIRPFYKMMLGKKIDLVDMESVVCMYSLSF